MTLSADPLFRDASVLQTERHLSRLIERQPDEYLRWVSAQYEILSRKPAVDSVLRHTLATETVPDGLVCEYGVATGNSVNAIARALAPRTVYGFDTFEGLPNDWVVGDITIPKGTIAIDMKKLDSEPNVKLFKGLFSESLPPFMAAHTGPMGFLHVDCDTYHSTIDIFANTGAHLQEGTLIVFDEILGDVGLENELRVLWEFSKRTGLGFEWLSSGKHCWTADTQKDFMKKRKFAPLTDLKLLFKNARVLTSMRKVEDCSSAAAIRVTRPPKI